MIYPRYLFNLIKQIIFKNPFKNVLILVLIISFHYAESFKPYNSYKKIITKAKDGSNWVYVLNGSQERYYVKYSQFQQPEKGGYLITKEYNDMNIPFWIVFGISAVVLIVLSIVGYSDEDFGWDLDYCKKLAINDLVYCEFEDGYFYYMIRGRLIEKRENQLRNNTNILDSYSHAKMLPKFSTKSQKRENILEKIGII